jgi:hypothetical protein
LVSTGGKVSAPDLLQISKRSLSIKCGACAAFAVLLRVFKMQICVLNTLSTVSVSARATLEEQDANWRVDQSRGNSAVEDLGGSGVALPKFAGGQLFRNLRCRLLNGNGV